MSYEVMGTVSTAGWPFGKEWRENAKTAHLKLMRTTQLYFKIKTTFQRTVQTKNNRKKFKTINMTHFLKKKAK